MWVWGCVEGGWWWLLRLRVRVWVSAPLFHTYQPTYLGSVVGKPPLHAAGAQEPQQGLAGVVPQRGEPLEEAGEVLCWCCVGVVCFFGGRCWWYMGGWVFFLGFYFYFLFFFHFLFHFFNFN